MEMSPKITGNVEERDSIRSHHLKKLPVVSETKEKGDCEEAVKVNSGILKLIYVGLTLEVVFREETQSLCTNQQRNCKVPSEFM